jgi:hypothetical protein
MDCWHLSTVEEEVMAVVEVDLKVLEEEDHHQWMR